MKSLGFKILIALDHLLNVLLLGEIGTCLSSRAYIQAQLVPNPTRRWKRYERWIDILMCEELHCQKSFAWELNRKQNWVRKHLVLQGK